MQTDQLLDAIANLTLAEAADLVKKMEERFGIQAQAPVAVAAAAPGAQPQEAAEEEKTEFTVVLKNFGSNKIAVIKAVRAITGMGLQEAKALVEAGNKPIKENISKEDAEKIASQLKEAGAEVEIR